MSNDIIISSVLGFLVVFILLYFCVIIQDTGWLVLHDLDLGELHEKLFHAGIAKLDGSLQRVASTLQAEYGTNTEALMLDD